jgi:hypothetical protein
MEIAPAPSATPTLASSSFNLSLRGFKLDANPAPECRRNVDKGINRKPIHVPTQKLMDARLGHATTLCRFDLP